jgi:ketosteroid isomerase-like protein
VEGVIADSNIDIVRRGFEAFNRGELDDLGANWHPDVEWTPPPDLPDSQTYHGHAAVREFLGEFTSVFAGLQAEAVEFRENGDLVAAHYIWRGAGAGSGVSVDSFEQHAWGLFEFSGGLLRRVRFWTAWDPELERAGMRQ